MTKSPSKIYGSKSKTYSNNSKITSSHYIQKKKGTKRRDPGKYGTIHFSDFPSFKPNLTPKEIIQMGSFGGTYFRPIYSSVINRRDSFDISGHLFCTRTTANTF